MVYRGCFLLVIICFALGQNAFAQDKLYLKNKITNKQKAYKLRKKMSFLLKDGRITEMTRVKQIAKEQIVCEDTIYDLNQVSSIIVHAPRTRLETSLLLLPITLCVVSPLLYGHPDEGIIFFWLLSAVSTPMLIANVVNLCRRHPSFSLEAWEASVK